MSATARMPLLVALACRGCGKRLGAVLEGSEVRCPRCGRWTAARQAADVTAKPAADEIGAGRVGVKEHAD